MTAALEGGEWSAARPGRTLPPGKTRYPLYRRQGRGGRAENLVPTAIRSRTVQAVVSHYTDWATQPTHTHTHTPHHTHTHTHTHTPHTHIWLRTDCMWITVVTKWHCSDSFLHKSGAVRSVDWIFIVRATAWRWMGEYGTLYRTF